MTRTSEAIRKVVRDTYAGIAVGSAGSCGTSCCAPEKGIDMIGDAYDGVAGHVADADLGLGCGLPVEHAGIRTGDTVLDLGSGAGNDVFVARHETGETGRVIGVDMTPEMVARARSNCERLGYDNVEFRLGEIEHLPVDASSIDVVVSNCVLNLVPEKEAAFAEIHRVLKPGARFCISDIVSSAPLPDWSLEIAALYAGCVAGAVPKDDYLDLIADAGFRDVQVVKSRRIDIPREVVAKYADKDQLAAAVSRDLHVMSITVTGTKP
ncbi:MAG: arsenite methyltransferase [Hyphomicrobiales bacterium]